MAVNYLILGQSAPSATTLTGVYTVPTTSKAIISSVAVCNRGSTTATFRISVAADGAADSNAQYHVYDAEVAANSTFIYQASITMSGDDVLRVYASNGNLSFNVSGAEVS